VKLSQAIGAVDLFRGRELLHPQYLIFFVTSQCVGRCRHCFYWEHINQKEDRLTIAEIESVAKSMGSLLQVTFTGGEPFLRDDFPEIVEIFHRVNQVYHLGIATSGYLPDKVAAGVRQILERCPGANLTVGLPIEGPKELNDEIRGREDFFNRTVSCLESLKALKKTWPRLTTLIDITASGFNAGRLIETYELVRDTLRPDAINLILTRGNPREAEAKTLDVAEVERLLTLMETDARAGRVAGYSFFSKLLHAKDLVLRRMALDIYRKETCDLPCAAGRIAGVLMPEGDVYPCELWHEPIGNVRESGLSMPAVWTSEKAQKARSQILDTRCACFHQCFLSNTIFFNLKAWPGIVKEWAKIR
jgi:radical SAM protein with 4Fe4S-binding SPASM domain